MNTDKLNEHIIKETFKRALDNNPNYPEWVKRDLKTIIDLSKSYHEMADGVLAYFAGQMFK